MRHYIYILLAALSITAMTGCTKADLSEKEGGPGGGHQNEDGIPEGYFVATFSTSSSRAESDFNGITGEDERVFDLRYLLYDGEGNFVKERLIFDDSDDDADDTQDWPLPAITDTLPMGNYKAVFITNTDPDLFQRKDGSFTLPDDLLSDYKLGFDQARLNMPYLLGAYDPDFFMDVIEFSHENPAKAVYLQRIVGVFKAYRSLVDVQEGLDSLVSDLVENITEGGLIENQVAPLLSGELGAVLSPLTVLLNDINLDRFVLDPLIDMLLEPVITALYEALLQMLIDEVGGLLEGNNESAVGDFADILDPLLNPWAHAEGVAVTVRNQPIQFGFDMEVKARDTIPHTYYLPIVDTIVNGNEKSVVIIKYLGFEDIDNDGVGEELMTLLKINAAIPGVVGGLLDNAVEREYLLPGALFDIEDSLQFHAPGNIQIYNEYSLADLGVDDYSQKGDSLMVGVTLRDVLNLDASLGGTLNFLLDDLLGMIVPVLELPIPRLITFGDFLEENNVNLMDLQIALPINLPLLSLDNLDVSGSWDPNNVPE